MNQRVRIYSRGQSGNPDELGAIVLKDGHLVPEPNILALTGLLHETLFVRYGGNNLEIDPEKEPELFLKLLKRALRGSYLWAGEVET